MDSISGTMFETESSALEEELHLKRSKHLFVQWLVSGNRRTIPQELKLFIQGRPEEARALFKHFRERSRKRIKGKKYLFAN